MNKRVIYRINKVHNPRIIGVYNRYFKRMGEDVVCEAPYNENPAPLVELIKSNNVAGAFTVAFEHDPRLLSLINSKSEMAQEAGVVGFITQKNGVITGHAQGYVGLIEALKRHIDITNKKVVIMGAGKLTRSFCFEIIRKHTPLAGIKVYNRTLETAQNIAKKYSCITKVAPLSELSNAQGDIFMNLSEVGSLWQQGEQYVFTEEFVRKFTLVLDPNFVPLKTPLIALAEKCGVSISPGYETFTEQTAYSLEMMLDIKIDRKILDEEFIYEFSNWR